MGIKQQSLTHSSLSSGESIIFKSISMISWHIFDWCEQTMISWHIYDWCEQTMISWHIHDWCEQTMISWHIYDWCEQKLIFGVFIIQSNLSIVVTWESLTK
jgi:hypothetical protein